jgi:hypothetical protein
MFGPLAIVVDRASQHALCPIELSTSPVTRELYPMGIINESRDLDSFSLFTVYYCLLQPAN